MEKTGKSEKKWKKWKKMEKKKEKSRKIEKNDHLRKNQVSQQVQQKKNLNSPHCTSYNSKKSQIPVYFNYLDMLRIKKGLLLATTNASSSFKRTTPSSSSSFFNQTSIKRFQASYQILYASEDPRYAGSSAVEVSVPLSSLEDQKQADFARSYLHKFLDSEGDSIITFSDKSRYQVENTRLAVERARHLVDTIQKLATSTNSETVETDVAEATKEWWPFIDMTGLNSKLKNNRTLLYGTDRAKAQITENGEALDAKASFNNLTSDRAAREYGTGVIKPYEVYPGRGYQKNFKALRNRSFNDERTTSEINKDAIVLIKSREKSRFIRKPITEPIIHAVEEVSEKMTV